jgi:ApbE superfamily uncharacterized protein (UPF0280 family)
MSGAIAARFADGRLHLQHGPIDLVIAADGARAAVEAAYAAAIDRFPDILPALVEELPLLKAPLGTGPPAVRGPVARRMAAAVWPYRAVYITPMAAVAGSVAQEILDAMTKAAALERAYVNNGGDIALHLAAGQSFRVGIVADLERPVPESLACVRATDPVRGVATSGWRGRSFSLGIADAVTVFARDAAMADAAATIVANAVEVEHEAILRRPANAVREDTDLGGLPVTVAVGPLPVAAASEALRRGAVRARALQKQGLIHSALLQLQGQWIAVEGQTITMERIAA